MPYIESTGKSGIKNQLDQWKGVMHDPRIDGYNGWACKQKLYEIKFHVDKLLENSPHYEGEEQWLKDQQVERAVNKLSGR